jgi:hypothetical protein
MVDMVIDWVAVTVNLTEKMKKRRAEESGGEKREKGEQARGTFEFFLTAVI